MKEEEKTREKRNTSLVFICISFNPTPLYNYNLNTDMNKNRPLLNENFSLSQKIMTCDNWNWYAHLMQLVLS